MIQYLELCETILKNGFKKNDRTNTGTISLFGTQTRYDLKKGFPLLTTKKVFFKAIVHELLWFIAGDTNIKYLVDNDVKIWNEWPYEIFKNSNDYNGETIQEFVQKIKNSTAFANQYGNLGPVYGKQWRDFDGVDQLKELVEQIKTNPNSRRLVLSSWNPKEIPSMALPPCHTLFQFYVKDNQYLSLQLYQRSGDVFLGVPFNIASYALLLSLVAAQCNLVADEFIHTIGDAHIYLNHLDQINTQLAREPKILPKLVLNRNVKSLFDYRFDDINIENYDPFPPLKGVVAV